jgi:hypothetical protein
MHIRNVIKKCEISKIPFSGKKINKDIIFLVQYINRWELNNVRLIWRFGASKFSDRNVRVYELGENF